MFRRVFILTNVVLETEKVKKIHMNCHQGQLCEVKKNTKVVIRVKRFSHAWALNKHFFALDQCK